MSTLTTIHLAFRRLGSFTRLGFLSGQSMTVKPPRLVIRRTQHSQANNSSEAEAPIRNLADQINARLADNQTQNILVYSCKSSGSLRINLMGVGGSVMLLFAAYNSWYLFSAFEGRKRNQSLEGNFMNFVLDTIQSSAFKYTLCGTIAVVGKSSHQSRLTGQQLE